jgi:hypothetical protein
MPIDASGKQRDGTPEGVVTRCCQSNGCVLQLEAANAL